MDPLCQSALIEISPRFGDFEQLHIRQPDDRAFPHDAGTNGIPIITTRECWKLTAITIVTQILPHQAKACESAEAESSYPTVDPSQNWQHNQVRSITPFNKLIHQFERNWKNKRLTGHAQIQRQETTLAQDQNRHLNYSPPSRTHTRVSIFLTRDGLAIWATGWTAGSGGGWNFDECIKGYGRIIGKKSRSAPYLFPWR